MAQKLKLLLNIGSADAQKLGLAESQRSEGKVVSLDPKVAEVLLRYGWATPEGEEPRAMFGRTGKSTTPRLAVNPPKSDVTFAEPPDGATAVRASKRGERGEDDEGDGEADDEPSPVADTPVGESIEMINRMRSREKLQQIVDSDQRSSVQEAARKRIEQLET